MFWPIIIIIIIFIRICLHVSYANLGNFSLYVNFLSLKFICRIYNIKPFLSRNIFYMLTSNNIAYKEYKYMPFLYT
jgi:hypothetical protein